MKKRILTALILILLVSCRALAEGGLSFGALSWETENGLSFFSDGGDGVSDIVGFELSKGTASVKIPQIGADIKDNICIKISGLANGEYQLRRFAKTDNGYVYSEAVYITAADGAYSVITREEKELADAKAAAKSELSGYIADKTVYREKELAVIDGILEKYNNLIDESVSYEGISGIVSSAKTELDGVHKKEWFDQNAEANKEVLLYLDDAYLWLCRKPPYNDSKFYGKEKQFVNIVKPVIAEVIADASAGEYVVTNEYIRAKYAADIAKAKKIYNEDMSETERARFNEKIAALNTETQSFLKEFFG